MNATEREQKAREMIARGESFSVAYHPKNRHEPATWDVAVDGYVVEFTVRGKRMECTRQVACPRFTVK